MPEHAVLFLLVVVVLAIDLKAGISDLEGKGNLFHNEVADPNS